MNMIYIYINIYILVYIYLNIHIDIYKNICIYKMKMRVMMQNGANEVDTTIIQQKNKSYMVKS